jgi:hypothetical protein
MRSAEFFAQTLPAFPFSRNQKGQRMIMIPMLEKEALFDLSAI